MFNIDKAISHTINVIEKGYVNHKDDRGKATKWGVTSKTYANHLGVQTDYIYLDHLIRNMPKSTAAMIFKSEYYYSPKINLMPDALQAQLFDICINSGPRRPYKILQRAIRKIGGRPLVIDGDFGKKSRLALDLIHTKMNLVNNEMVDFRIKFYKRIVRRYPKQKSFINGWLNRAEKFRI